MMAWGKRTKFGNKKVEHAGYSFGSQLERAVFEYYRLRQVAGEISDLRTQDSVYLTNARILYKPDFVFIENGETKWAEAKGFETSDWRIKLRLWRHYGPGSLSIWKGSAKKLYLDETVVPVSQLKTECGAI